MNYDPNRLPPLDYDHKDSEPPNWGGCGRVVLAFWLLIAVLLSLTGCAGVHQVNPLLTQKSVIMGEYECDPTGACWPKDFTVTKHIRYKHVPAAEINQLCRGGLRGEDAERVRPDWEIFACTLLGKSPSPIVVLPEGWFPEWLKRHEEGHAEGLTVRGLRKVLEERKHLDRVLNNRHT